MLDAYTVRKIAPRLLFAVIGVNLSIYLCIAAIDITNVVGHGVAQLIRAPFDIGGTLNSTIDQGSANVAAPVMVATALVGLTALKGGALATIFALILPVFVIIILAVLTLVIRQALLVLLTLVSPVAIVLAVLPGTERFFRQWLDLFFRTLIIYPMIAALFAVSDVLTAISFNNSNVGSNLTGTIDIIAGIMFAFMPIALIPFTFRLSGGILGAFSNATGNLRSMANQWSSRRLQQNIGQGYQKIAGGGLFKNTRMRGTGEYLKNDKGEYVDEAGNVVDDANRVEIKKGHGFRHRMNMAASRAANMHRITEGWGGVVAASDRAIIRHATALKESEEAKALAGFDDEMFVLANYGKGDWHDALIRRAAERFDYRDMSKSAEERAERQRNLNNAMSMMAAYQKVGGANATRAAAAVELHGISTSYKSQYYLKDDNEEDGIAKDANGKAIMWDENLHDDEMKGKVLKTSHDQMQQTILNASGGQRGLGNWIAAQSIGAAKQAGRYDMAASASAVLMYQEALRSGDQKAVKKMQDYYDKMMVERITPAQALQGHPRAAEEMANALQKRLDSVTSKLNSSDVKTAGLDEMQSLQEEYARTLADIAGYHDTLGSSGSEAVTHFDKMLGRTIQTTDEDGHAVTRTVSREIDAYRNNYAFKQRRREYGSAEEAEEAARGRPPEEKKPAPTGGGGGEA